MKSFQRLGQPVLTKVRMVQLLQCQIYEKGWPTTWIGWTWWLVKNSNSKARDFKALSSQAGPDTIILQSWLSSCPPPCPPWWVLYFFLFLTCCGSNRHWKSSSPFFGFWKFYRFSLWSDIKRKIIKLSKTSIIWTWGFSVLVICRAC